MMSSRRDIRSPAAAAARFLLRLRWVRFGLVGLCATGAYAALGLIFVSAAGLPPLFGNALAFALSFAVSYLGQSLWTFGAAGSHVRMLTRFAMAQGLGLALNTCIIWLGMAGGLAYPWAMCLAIAITPVFVYLLCRLWVFRERRSIA